jgi:hypothetical protein
MRGGATMKHFCKCGARLTDIVELMHYVCPDCYQPEEETKIMRTLNLSANVWDLKNFFMVEGIRGDVQLMQDYNKVNDGIYWGLQAGTAIKATYTAEEVEHRERMKTYDRVKDGEIVLIGGEQFKTRVLGNFSDCVIFDKWEG